MLRLFYIMYECSFQISDLKIYEMDKNILLSWTNKLDYTFVCDFVFFQCNILLLCVN